ncbi:MULTISPECIES: anti-CBASS protein Acb1 family protein [Acinetobacter]|uniref:anti-CBASS protein Acb1 family protein n=1 Tax=Acinetobacter TaxID=469 RepID=UPI001F4AA3F0|nr:MULTISPECIES: anti-CBASS Acb1 family protein [Acinetobacter]MCH7381618.1 DUF1073 domain-containing protein [Acinetobacter higginsii]
MKFREKLLSLLIRWLRFATPVESENTSEGEKPKRRKISTIALNTIGAKSQNDVIKFKMPTLPKGVVPDGEGLAMDSGGMVGYANAAGVSMNFLGYPILSELSQRSEYRAPVQTLATEMTRKWIQFKSIGSDDLSEEIKQIEVAFDHFKIRDAFKLATEHDGFFGRGNLFIEIDGNDDRETPLIVDKATIKKGSLKQLKVIEPIWTTPVNYDSVDPTNKYFYKPNMWYVMGKPVHSTRLFTFVSHPVSDMLKPSYNFSGLSMTQMMMPYVDNWLSTRDSVSDLIHSFSISGIKTNLDTLLGDDGTDATDFINRVELFNRTRDNRGLMALDNTEEFFQHNTPLSGLDKLQAQAQEQMASPCHIPLVKLFGVTPSGLNASSEGEIKVYYDYVAAQQQNIFTDPLVTILKIIQLHLFGQIFDDITFEFVPLEQMTEEQIANINKTKAETGATLVEANIISQEEERTRLADDSFSGYNSLDAETLPERREDSPAMDADGEWDESKHPRADNGQFGSGGGSSNFKEQVSKLTKENSVTITNQHSEQMPANSLHTPTVREALKEILVGKHGESNPVVNKATGHKMIFTTTNLKASLAKNGKDNEKERLLRSLYPALPELYEKAIPDDPHFEPNTKPEQKPGIAGYRNYLVHAEVGGNKHLVRIGVDVPHPDKEGNAPRSGAYYFHKLEIGQ